MIFLPQLYFILIFDLGVFHFHFSSLVEFPVRICAFAQQPTQIFFSKPKQDEIESDGGQVEPPGMNMIYLPYANDIRDIEEARKKSF